MLAKVRRIDAVALCTPPQVRHAQAAAALKAGKHVMLEKPPGATVSELDPLIAAAPRSRADAVCDLAFALCAGGRAGANCLARAGSIRCVIEWKEDVRVWHPGQAWIWEPGGLGVFDPGINALSILTRILPQPLFLTAAELSFPGNREAPIAARLSLTIPRAADPAEFDFRQTGPQSWDIVVDTDRGPLTLSGGGARLVPVIDRWSKQAETEYRGIYRRFIELTATGFTMSTCRRWSCRRCLPARPSPQRRNLRRLTMADAKPNVQRTYSGVA